MNPLRIGLLADSHGRAQTTARGVHRLLDAGAELLIHLGDVGSVEVIDALLVSDAKGGGSLPVHLVFGNTDWDRQSLWQYATDLGVTVDHPVGKLAIAGRGELVFLHGDDTTAMQRALADKPAYLCHGHSHRQLDQKLGPTRVINPGALFRAERYTVALLDPRQDRVEFFVVDSA